MRKITVFFLLMLCAQALIAEQKPEETDTNAGDLYLQVSSMPGAKLGFVRRYIFPFLQGESPLTKDNNISLALTFELSPVSVNGIAEAVWTPAAFFQLAAGGRIGSGWNLELFGEKIYGIGINRPNAEGKAETAGSAFDGLLWKAQTGAVLQGDLAAVFPGDWNHAVARSYHEINYKGYTRASADESWYYESDNGENCNGFNYYGNFLIGYRMPVFFNLAGFLTEMDLRLYNTPDRAKWGDDKIQWTFSGLVGFYLAKKLDLILAAQFRTRINYQETNWQDLYYRNRTVNNSSPARLEFYRVAAALTYKF